MTIEFTEVSTNFDALLIYKHRAASVPNESVLALEASDETIEDYEGMCGELCNVVTLRIPDAEILYIHLDDHPEWTYHMVPIVNGLVHCAWFPGYILPPSEYVLVAFFGHCIRWSITGADGEITMYP